MTIRNLDALFAPASIAQISPGPTTGTVAGFIRENLFSAGFKGALFSVHTPGKTAESKAGYPDVASLPQIVDLAVIAMPPDTVPALLAELGKRGTRAAVVISSGFSANSATESQKLQSAMLNAARPHLMRIIGPNSLGIMIPGAGINAGYSHIRPLPGNLAFVSQSGTVLTTVLDWATARKIGFSHCLSLGDMADVDFGDMLDYLANDYSTRAILLYIEKITGARKFMSAARAAARNKPVIVVKAGDHAEGLLASPYPASTLPRRDAVYDAAFRRAGILRVKDLQALFDAVQTLAMTRKISGDRLAILTNSDGIGILTTDTLVDRDGRLAVLSQDTLSSLDHLLPSTWSHGNPVDIQSDAPARRYAEALAILDKDKETDAILVLNCPTALASSTDAAQAVVNTLKTRAYSSRQKEILTCWLGEQSVQDARHIFTENKIPTYATPTEAVRGFMQLVRYRKSQEMLMETVPSIPETYSPDSVGARHVIDTALAEDRPWLTGAEATALLNAYAIPFVLSYPASSPHAAALQAEKIGGPAVLKIMSDNNTPDLELIGTCINLETPDVVRKNAEAMLQRIRIHAPDADIRGFMVQPVVHRPHSHKFAIKMVVDDLFGPVLMLGSMAMEVTGDLALSIPPLNMHLAHELLARTRMYTLLQGYPGREGAHLDSIALTLVKISQLVADHAEITELDIAPVLADKEGVLVLDAHIKVVKTRLSAIDRLAILPYPKELEETLRLPDGQTLLIRPIRPEDEPNLQKIFASLTPEEIRLRFLHPMNTLSHPLAARLTQIDYDREMSLVVEEKNDAGAAELYGVVQISADPDKERAEYAILLRHDMTGLGLGPMLLRRIIDYARSQGIGEIFGEVLSDNRTMLRLCRAFGFTVKSDREEPGIVQVTLKL
jgi:acetyltransferase